MSPVHADDVDRSVAAERDEIAQSRLQEPDELELRHFAGSHRKFSMLDRAQAADVAVDRHIIGRIDEGHFRLFAVK
jgi:hypothetical protein